MAYLFASTKDDIGNDMQVQGLNSNYELTAGSYVITAAGDIGLLDFDGTWHWVGEDEDAPVSTLSVSRSALTMARPIADTAEVEPVEETVEETVEEEISDEDEMR